jgi:methionine-rich copper-binding protein CopC
MISIRALCVAVLLSTGMSAFVRPPAPNAAAGVRRHTHLEKSEPANNDTIARSPAAIRLWFSEKVELPVTTVKLADAAGGAIALAPLARPDTGEKAPVIVSLQKPLAAGNYVVTWMTAAKDGHPSNGTIAFTVKATH